MSGFHLQRLRRLQQAAGLYPLPSFYVPGERWHGDKESDFIDSRYFSPAALRWADEVHEYFATGGTLPSEEMECLARVWTAMRAGRKPTAPQIASYSKEQKWKWAESRVPELYAIEMQARGHKSYGPDFELPDGVEGPGSWQELTYKYLFRELGYRNPAGAKARHNEWKAKSRGTR